MAAVAEHAGSLAKPARQDPTRHRPAPLSAPRVAAAPAHTSPPGDTGAASGGDRAEADAAPAALAPPLPSNTSAANATTASAITATTTATATGSTGTEPPAPVYATRLPAPATLEFQLQRGALVGSGQLVWQRHADCYALSLDGELQGNAVLGSISRGGIDADGVAPVRLVDRRRARELRAANFQRDVQRITFSGPQLDYPLSPGAQDRLSWMIQLPAIVAADPALSTTDARVTLFVVGTRGDAEVWHFEVRGRETLSLPAGPVAQALHLRREPRRPYDTRIDVWLDPARQHLPVRAVFATVPDGTPTELRLSRIAEGPV